MGTAALKNGQGEFYDVNKFPNKQDTHSTVQVHSENMG